MLDSLKVKVLFTRLMEVKAGLGRNVEQTYEPM
jgi:hypothetical protein